MTPSEMVTLLRKLINDEQATGFTDGGNMEEPESTDELLHYLDRAVNEYSQKQAALGDIRLIKTLTLRSGMTLPEDFLRFCGSVPLSVTGKTLTYYGEANNLPIKYMARLPYVTSYGMNAVLPYDRDAAMSIVQLAAIYALNKQEYNVTQDLLLLGYGVNNGSANQ